LVRFGYEALWSTGQTDGLLPFVLNEATVDLFNQWVAKQLRDEGFRVTTMLVYQRRELTHLNAGNEESHQLDFLKAKHYHGLIVYPLNDALIGSPLDSSVM
jgi:hypothetical protein